MDDAVKNLKDAKLVGSTRILTWRLEADKEGYYFLDFIYKNETKTKKILITTEQRYENPVNVFKNSNFKRIEVLNKKFRPLGNFSLFGWRPGWLSFYIILSLFASVIIRKIMNVS